MNTAVKPNTAILPVPNNAAISQDFSISRIAGIPCAYCGKDMPTADFLNKIFSSDAQTDTQMLQNALKLRYILPPYKQEILDTLKEIQISMGLTSDNKVLQAAKYKSQKAVKEDVLKRYDNIESIIEKSKDEKLKLLIMQNGEKFRKLLTRSPNYGTLLNIVKFNLYGGYFNITFNETHSKIKAVIADIEKGKAKYLKDYILKKIIFWKAKEFYTELFKQTISSVDHVIPKSKGGSGMRDNFLAVCKECNEQKSNTPLPLFMATRPDIKENIKKQLELLRKIIPNLVLRRRLDKDYLDYPENISRNLNQITNGSFDIIA